MKKGQKVMIYQDPWTKKKPEGEAILVARVVGEGADGQIERWMVRFIEDGPDAETYSRDIEVMGYA